MVTSRGTRAFLDEHTVGGAVTSREVLPAAPGGVGGTGARVFWERGALYIDPGNLGGGLEKNGRAVGSREPLAHGDHVLETADLARDDWRFSVVRVEPEGEAAADLERVKRIGDWVAYDVGRDLPTASRWWVLHLDDPRRQGMLVAGAHMRTADARCLELFSLAGVSHAVFDVPRGPLLFTVVAHARVQSQPAALGLLARVRTEIAALPDRYGLAGDDIALSWDGDVVIRPVSRGRPLAFTTSILEDIGALVSTRHDLGDARALLQKTAALDDAGTRDLVRALLPRAWEREQRLREELATLDRAAVRWLLSR